MWATRESEWQSAMRWAGQRKELRPLSGAAINHDMEFIKKYWSSINLKQLLLACPEHERQFGSTRRKKRPFLNRFRIFTAAKLCFWDERLTTVSAHKAMIEADMSRKKRKQRVDQVAAVLILQSYLDYLNRK
jgi:putative Holliday junction resolvase